MGSLLSLALLAVKGDGFEQGLYFGSFSARYVVKSFLGTISVLCDQRSSPDVDFLTVGIEDLSY